jgi:hypothetical protein
MAQQQAGQESTCITSCNGDDCADAFAAVATIAILVGATVYWLSGMA